VKIKTSLFYSSSTSSSCSATSSSVTSSVSITSLNFLAASLSFRSSIPSRINRSVTVTSCPLRACDILKLCSRTASDKVCLLNLVSVRSGTCTLLHVFFNSPIVHSICWRIDTAALCCPVPSCRPSAKAETKPRRDIQPNAPLFVNNQCVECAT
jgi:hypothetical protein